MSNHSIKIGIMSFAHGHANSYATCLQKLPDVTFAGIYDNDLQRGQTAADQYGVPFFTTANELLALSLDGVIICSENANHRPMVEIAAGKVAHILCEKPIASSAQDGQAMIDCCAATNTKLQIAFPVRFAPAVQWLKEQVNSDDLGTIYAVQTTNHGSLPNGDWFIDKALSGGGAVIDHTVHVIDLLRWFWNTEVTEIYAEVGQDLLHADLGIDDVGLLSFTLANGIYGTLDTSWSRPPSYTRRGDVKIEVTAEKGVIFVDAFRQHLAVSSDAVGKTQWLGWGSNMDLGLIRDFVEMIRNGTEPSISGHDGLAALEVALAAYRSAEVGEPVALR